MSLSFDLSRTDPDARETTGGLFSGSADQDIPMDDGQSMKDALAGAGSKSQIHLHDSAPHAFHADYRPTFRSKEPAEDDGSRMLTWLRSNGV